MASRAIRGAPATSTLDLAPDVGIDFTRLSEDTPSTTIQYLKELQL